MPKRKRETESLVSIARRRVAEFGSIDLLRQLVDVVVPFQDMLREVLRLDRLKQFLGLSQETGSLTRPRLGGQFALDDWRYIFNWRYSGGRTSRLPYEPYHRQPDYAPGYYIQAAEAWLQQFQ